MTNMEGAKQQIKELLDKYNKTVEEGKILKEESTKTDFILPLFRALGWETENSNEVSKEEKISKKRVDYGFRINGIPKFFLEAKALDESLAGFRMEDGEKVSYVQKAINYAWHKSCTWAVLANFKEIIMLNAEVKDANNIFIRLSSGRFLDNFDKLWLLSRESFEQGLLDKEAEGWGKKTKKISVDKQLLEDFTRFRDMLSKNITRLNQSKNITEDDLDESIQRILDRLIFIRNCEDRELEAKTLLPNLREWESRGKGQLIKSLMEVFSYFDREYNSKIFAKHLCDDLDIDNEVLHELIEGLYYTKDKSISYDFSAIEADVLGNIYEQYLGHILKKTEKRAKLTESQAHRKEQGIYYTPTYIVDYIVRNTVCELLKDKKTDPKKLRVLDPACGSGSFLIKAFDLLYKQCKDKDEGYSQTKFDSNGKLYTAKTEILQNNIFGVDLDKQAVEIAQLNLLLKIAERGHRLPLLQQNIQNGNSLIDDPNIADDKAFNWNERFKRIMDEGGFDVVMGNPPYIRNTELSDNDKIFFNEKYISAVGQYDIFVLFLEIGIRLLKNEGYLGFITSNKFIASEYGQKLRENILRTCKIRCLVDVSHLKVFKDASTYPVIIILQKDDNENNRKNNYVAFYKINDVDGIGLAKNAIKVKQLRFMESGDNRFLEDRGGKKFELVKKIEAHSSKIGDVFICQRGSPKNKIDLRDEKAKNALSCIISRDVDKYSFKLSNNIFVKSLLQDKILSKQKILIPRTVLSLRAAYDEGNHFIMDRIYYLIPKDNNKLNLKFAAGLLNSKVADFYYKVNFGSTHVGGGYLDLRGSQIVQIPLINASESQQQTLVKLVDKMLSFNKRLNEIGGKRTDERARIEDEIKKTDAEIDELVYKLYGITEDEKKIIEGSLT